MKWQSWLYLLSCLFLLTACSRVSVDGHLQVNVNADGSGRYQFTLLTQPQALPYFAEYEALLKKQHFQLTSLRRDQRVGWIARKHVADVLHEPLPLALSTATQPGAKQAVTVDKGFYQTIIRVNYPLDLTQITEQSPLVTLIQDRIHLRLSVALPVAFVEQNATTISKDKKTATWQLKVGQINQLRASVMIPNPIGWIVTLAGAGILLILLIAVLIWMRKKYR
jgi:hypothetical protein